jgi:2-hydroxychromene-2-carboxylate isomerase
MQATWYFDVISPYAYLAFKLHEKIQPAPEIEYVPVLFAGLLKAHNMTGPAEIAEKRRHTYRMCVWTAQQHGIAFRLPPAHPFNPLHALRLLIGAGVTRAHIEAVFDAVWNSGEDINQPDAFARLANKLGVSDAAATIARPEVKQQLVANTERALARGIYGVPTFDVGGELFWGADTLPMLNAWLADQGMFKREEMARIDALPAAAMRKEAV